MRKRIIIVGVQAGGGHIAAMKSLERSLADLDGFTLETFLSNITSINSMHEFFTLKLPLIYELFYNISEYKRYNPFHKFIIANGVKNLEEELSKFFHDPSVEKIISTHLFCTETLVFLKKKYNSKIKIIGYVPDFDSSPVHIPIQGSQKIDGFIVQSYRFINIIAQKYNYPQKSLQKAGFLCAEEFSEVNQKSSSELFELLTSLPELKSISSSKSRVVIAGGSSWTGKISRKVEKLVQSLLYDDIAKVQFIVVSGSNLEAVSKYEKLKRLYPKLDLLILPKLAHNHLAAVYKLADIVLLASIAPATMYELMQVNAAPLLLVKTNPGQEFYNKRYFLEAGVIELVEDQATLNKRLKELLQDEAELNRTRQYLRHNYKAQIDASRDNARRTKEFIQKI